MHYPETLTLFGSYEAKEVEGVVGCACDRQQVHRPLEHPESQSRREIVTLAAAPDGVLWVDSSGHILMTNPAMEALSGYSSAELLGQHVAIFLPERLRGRHVRSI